MVFPRIEEWENRLLSAVYPIVFIDAVHLSVRDDGVIRKLAAYVVLGINEDGTKEVLSIIVLTFTPVASQTCLPLEDR